ncbi:MAG: lytic transglycosylase domain-containing protein [Bacillota bacterium]
MPDKNLPPYRRQEAGKFTSPRDFLDAPDARPLPRINGVFLNAIFRAAANRYGLSPALLKAIGKVLSGLKADNLSPGGRMGIMQLTPDAARMLKINDPFDPVENIFGGARYLRRLLDRYRGNLQLALAAYYGVEEVSPEPDSTSLPRETQEFVTLVLTLTVANAGQQPRRPRGGLFDELADLFKNGRK